MEPRTPARAPESAATLAAAIARGGPAVIALSGGVDSAVVASLARSALGVDATAVTITGPAVSESEVARARSVARHLGILHELLVVDPVSVPEYRANPSNRCYFCRRTETGAILRWSEGRGFRQFLDGVHVDDLTEERPGLVAMEEAGFRHPLLDGGWGKGDVRAYAARTGLPNHDAPSDACLASRVAHGRSISVELLERVERAESIVHALGFSRVRVRTDGRSARIEVDPSEVARLAERVTAATVTSGLTGLGFEEVSIDPAGYRNRARR